MKDEEVYLKDYRSVPEAIHGLWGSVEFDNRERFHQSLHDQTPAAVYRQGQKRAAVATVN
jgi:putative transposase